MQQLNFEQQKDIGLKFVLDLLEPACPYGTKRLKNLHIYLPEEKAELEAALGGAGEKAKEQIRRELRELYMSAGAKKESMLGLYSGSMKSVRGLLRRNPTAVSPTYSETLAELKRLKNVRLEDVVAKVNERFSALMSGAGEKLGEYRTERREKKEEKREERREKLEEVKEELKEKYDRK